MGWLERLVGTRREAPAAAGVAVDQPPAEPRVLVFTEHFNATYFISFDLPLRRLHAAGRASFRACSQQDVAASAGQWTRWIEEFRPQVVVFTRYGAADGPEILRHCKARDIPVVYHIDDDLLELPPSLGAEILKRQGAAAQARRAMLAECDLIYASTAELAKVLGSRFPRQPLVQGIYASYRELRPAAPREHAGPVIGYMGSKGHREDLELVVPALVDLMQARPELRFETFGTIEMPAELRRFEGRVRHHPVQKSYAEFLQSMADLGWSIGLAPLVDEPFNRCKAPTKFIEYTSCGIPAVASNLPVYADAIPAGAGLLVGEDWKGALEAVLDSPDRRASMLDAARRHCSRTFSPERLEGQVEEVLRAARGPTASHPTGAR